MIEYITKTTLEIDNFLFDSLVNSFNIVFKKNETKDYFKKKYLTTNLGYSLHVLMLNNENVVGAYTVIPYEYKFGDQIGILGLLVDVFIKKEFRNNPGYLYKMYRLGREFMKQKDIKVMVSIPNEQAYPYWIKVVKWREIGQIPYYAFPIRLGNILKKHLYLNLFSLSFSYIYFSLSYLFSFIYPSQEKKAKIILIKSTTFEKSRYEKHLHKKIVMSDCTFVYRVINEDGIQTAYLIDFYENATGIKTLCALSKAINHINNNDKIDIIIFLGKLNLFQTLLFKVPKNKIPRKLPILIDTITDEIEIKKLVENYNNWDFGLLNYDVR